MWSLILILYMIMLTLTSLCQPPYNTFIIVRNAKNEVVTHLVDVLVEGSVRRLNVTHFATYISNFTKLTVLKDGVVVYEMNLTPPEGYQVVEVRARLQHLTLRFQGLPKEVLIIVKYSDVSISRYVKHSLELRNIPYPVNLTISIPYAKFSQTVLYNGEEVITIKIKEPECNVYLRFYDALLRPLPPSTLNVTVPPHFTNQTHVGYKLAEPVKVGFSLFGVKVGEVTVVPPRERFDIKTIDVKLPVGPLKVIAPPGTVIEVVLPSGKKFVKNCTVGEVQFDNVPTCKLLLVAKKGNLRSEKSIDFPGVLTVTVGFEQPSRLAPLLTYLPYIMLGSVVVAVSVVAVRALKRPPKPKPRPRVEPRVVKWEPKSHIVELQTKKLPTKAKVEVKPVEPRVREMVKVEEVKPKVVKRVRVEPTTKEVQRTKVEESLRVERIKPPPVEAKRVKTAEVKRVVVKEEKPKAEEEGRVKPTEVPELPPPPPPEWLATLKELKEIKELEIPQDIFSKPEEFKGDLSKILRKRRKFKRKRRT